MYTLNAYGGDAVFTYRSELLTSLRLLIPDTGGFALWKGDELIERRLQEDLVMCPCGCGVRVSIDAAARVGQELSK